MILRFAKTAVVILLGLALLWQSVTTALAFSVASAKPSCTCCHFNPDSCPTPPCCVKHSENRNPPAPASSLSVQKIELQALAAPVSSRPVLPLYSTDESRARVAQFVLVTAIPLFQRDCSYLI
jgi:hypothetical protein